MKLSMKHWRSSLVVVGIFVALLGSTMAFADNINPGVLDINGKVGGLTYGQLSEQWWQLAFSLPESKNPLVGDYKNENPKCSAGQKGPVWFLAGTTGGPATRSCTVPAGKYIMFPIFNTEQSVVEAKAAFQQTNKETTCTVGTTPIRDINGKTIKGLGYGPLHRCAQGIAQHALPQQGGSLEADVDGNTLKNPEHYRAATPPPLFSFTTVEGNPFGLCPALGPCPLSSKSAADGFWIILTPLSAGTTHTIHFKADVPDFGFTTEVTYTLTVG